MIVVNQSARSVHRRSSRGQNNRTLRILLSDGSGLTARQVATQLGEAGHEVHVVAPDPLCLARWTRHVRRVHRVPAYGRDPFGWLERTLDVLRGGFDALLVTQEQVAVLSRESGRVCETGAAIAVPPFAALKRVQDKLSARATLAELKLGQPAARVVQSIEDLCAVTQPPVFVKTPIGTATAGVWFVRDRSSLAGVAEELSAQNAFAGDGLLVQELVEGPLVMVQGVFSRGHLVASHANLRVRLGSSGGASSKRSFVARWIDEDLARLGRGLEWHGALSLDAVLTAEGPLYIDVNPRLVEPGNAWLAGLDLVEALLHVTLGSRQDPIRSAHPDIATHQLLIAILGAAEKCGRSGVLRELCNAALRRGSYCDSYEELTPIRNDPLAAIPVASAAAALLAAPALSRLFTRSAVENYALTPSAWRAICQPLSSNDAVEGPIGSSLEFLPRRRDEHAS
jgi:predicted ATP-grasp superfamily ATP-dependent carboligase